MAEAHENARLGLLRSRGGSAEDRFLASAWLGASQGLALTLAGVTGLIVSIGVSVDSNVVYFEHLKEDVKGGRTVRSSAVAQAEHREQPEPHGLEPLGRKTYSTE